MPEVGKSHPMQPRVRQEPFTKSGKMSWQCTSTAFCDNAVDDIAKAVMRLTILFIFQLFAKIRAVTYNISGTQVAVCRKLEQHGLDSN